MGTTDQPVAQSALEEAKLRALAEFAAGAGHEINNPVATIVGYVQLLLAGESDPERRQALLTISGQAYRIRDMIGDVMLFARPPEPRPVSLDLAAVTRELIDQFELESLKSGCRITLNAPQATPIFADPVQLRVVISSLLRNSVEALRKGGNIEVSVGCDATDVRTWAVLRVADNGPGLRPVDREHLFDPFYSGRQAGRGLGFGLSKCWRIVTSHGGRIEVDSTPGRGTVFIVHWPSENSETNE